MVSVVIPGFGSALLVTANVKMNLEDALVKDISNRNHKEFGNIKIALDVWCIVAVLMLSLVLFDFSIVGTREETIVLRC